MPKQMSLDFVRSEKLELRHCHPFPVDCQHEKPDLRPRILHETHDGSQFLAH